MTKVIGFIVGIVVSALLVLAVKEGLDFNLKTGEWEEDRIKREHCEATRSLSRIPKPDAECDKYMR